MNGILSLSLAEIKAEVKAREIITHHEMMFLTEMQKMHMMAEVQDDNRGQGNDKVNEGSNPEGERPE